MDPDGSGWPVVKGITRHVPVEALVVNHADGEPIEDVAYMFECVRSRSCGRDPE